MSIAVLSSESKSDLQLIVDLANKLNLKTQILSNEEYEIVLFNSANESALIEWLSPEEDEAWKNL